MKKALVGLAAVGGIVVVGVLARRMAPKMGAHARQMAEHCKQMAAANGCGEARSSSSATATKSAESKERQEAHAVAPTA
jgi:hypothetical protein